MRRVFSPSRCSLRIGFHLGELLAELIGLAERLLVVVGDRDQKCGDLDLVEAVQAAAETPLAEVKGSDVHAP